MKNNASLAYSFFLVLGDAFAITAAFTAAYILRVSLDHTAVSSNVSALTYITILISLLPLWILIFALIGLYNSRVYENRFSEFGRLLVGVFIGVLTVISYAYITNTQVFPARLVTLYAFLLAFFFVLLARTISRVIRRELFSFGVGINNVLLVGDTLSTERLLDALSNSKVTGYRVVGVVGGDKHSFSEYDVHVFPSFARAVSGLSKHLPHTIVQTELYKDKDVNEAILTYAQEHHVAYRFVPSNSELFVGKIVVDLFHSIPVIAVHQTALIGWGRVVKRLTDILLSTLLILLASPIMLLVALAVKLTDGGPVFFRQERLSRFNTPIRIFKFRSNNLQYNGLLPEEAFTKMGRPELIAEYRANGDSLPNDPRVTRVGRFIRKTSLDELPQLFNVFKGDISLVGPRALVANELEQYDKKNLILSVKSGITGLAQISGVSDLSFEERRKLDLYYVQNWTFWGDMVILAKTISVVLFHRGTRG